MRSIFVSILILAMMTVACRSESSSRACKLAANREMKCVENKDPNGAGSDSGSLGSGETGGVGFRGIIHYHEGKILKVSCKVPEAVVA
ncbi:hypothetical protein TNCV_758191 [Trichonephila clavipes]|nr:hypothetical protein TNCV_758191 [Trichonephila clavipes]